MRAFIASALLLTSMLSVLPDLAYAQFEPMDPLHVRADVTRTGWRSKYDQYIVNLLTKGDVGTDQEWAEVCVEAGDNPYGIPSHHVNVAVASCDVGVPYGDICANRAYCRPPCSTILDRWSGVCGCPQGHILNYETRECIPDPCTELPSEWIELAVTSEIGQCHNYKDRIIVPDDPELLCQQYIVDTSVDEQNRCWVYVDYEVRGDYDDIMNPGGDDPGGDDPGGDDPGGDDPGGDDPGGDDPGGDDPGGDDPGGDDPGGDDPGGDDPGGDDPGGDDPGGDDPGGDDPGGDVGSLLGDGVVSEPSFEGARIDDVATFSDSSEAFMARVRDAPLLSAIADIGESFPSAGACPLDVSINLGVWGTTIRTDFVCSVFETIRPALSAAFMALWVLVGYRILASA